jgi:hypothetical protein
MEPVIAACGLMQSTETLHCWDLICNRQSLCESSKNTLSLLFIELFQVWVICKSHEVEEGKVLATNQSLLLVGQWEHG